MSNYSSSILIVATLLISTEIYANPPRLDHDEYIKRHDAYRNALNRHADGNATIEDVEDAYKRLRGKLPPRKKLKRNKKHSFNHSKSFNSSHFAIRGNKQHYGARTYGTINHHHVPNHTTYSNPGHQFRANTNHGKSSFSWGFNARY